MRSADSIGVVRLRTVRYCVRPSGHTGSHKRMKVAYFDCFSGVSGDMTLGALVDAGLELAVLRDGLSKLPMEHYRLEAELVKRSGLRGTKVHVLIDEVQQPTRKYMDIVKMITESDLVPEVARQALDIFRRLGEVEAHLHHE